MSHTDVEWTVGQVAHLARIYYPSDDEGKASFWMPHYEYGAGFGDFTVSCTSGLFSSFFNTLVFNMTHTP